MDSTHDPICTCGHPASRHKRSAPSGHGRYCYGCPCTSLYVRVTQPAYPAAREGEEGRQSMAAEMRGADD